MDKNYRRTEDGVLLVCKEKAGTFGSLDGMRQMWYQCSDKDADRQMVLVLIGGWFGLHKFLERSYLQGVFYLFTCGCFGVFYLYDLLQLLVGNYWFKDVEYVQEERGLVRNMHRIYYGPIENKKLAALWMVLAVGILLLVVNFVYQPIGEGVIGWIAKMVSGNVSEEMVEKVIGL